MRGTRRVSTIRYRRPGRPRLIFSGSAGDSDKTNGGSGGGSTCQHRTCTGDRVGPEVTSGSRGTIFSRHMPTRSTRLAFLTRPNKQHSLSSTLCATYDRPDRFRGHRYEREPQRLSGQIGEAGHAWRRGQARPIHRAPASRARVRNTADMEASTRQIVLICRLPIVHATKIQTFPIQA